MGRMMGASRYFGGKEKCGNGLADRRARPKGEKSLFTRQRSQKHSQREASKSFELGRL